MSSLVNLLEKFEFEVQNKKGHRHLYDRFDEIMQSLQSGEGESDEEQRALESAVSMLAFEGDMFTGFPGYNFYVVRCYICAFRLFEYVRNENRRQWLQPKMDGFLAKIKDHHLIPYFPKDFFDEYNRQLLDNAQTESVLESIRQCFDWCDAGRRPHDYYKEKEMHDNFVRGYDLANDYLSLTHDYERYVDWFKILDPVHVGEILASIPEDPQWDDIGNLVDDTLTMQIEMLEDWKRNSFDSFVANGGVSLLARCLEY